MKNQHYYVFFTAFLFLVILGLCFTILTLHSEQKEFKKVISDRITENTNSINYISSGMSLSEKRLRNVLQTESIIKHFNPSLKSEFVNSLAMIIVDVTSKYPNFDHITLCALIAVESRFNPEARSPVGAKGLTQIMDQTAEFICERFAWRFDSTISLDPEKNVLMGAYYFNRTLDWTKRNKEYALANYNGGHVGMERFKLAKMNDSGAILDSLQIVEAGKLPLETKEYPKKVMDMENFMRMRFAFNLQMEKEAEIK